MSTDEAVTKDVLETLEDGKDGYTKGAEKLSDLGDTTMITRFRDLAGQRTKFADELQRMAKAYGDDPDRSGSVVATLHRGWMTLKDALSGSDPEAVLDVAEQGEDHAKSEYAKALDADISAGLRTVVARQYTEVQQTHDIVRDLRDAYATA